MTAPKFTHRDRLLLAGMIEPHVSRVSYGGRDSLPREDIAAEAVRRADDLLVALAVRPAPACVGEDRSMDLVATLLPYAETRAEDMQANVNEATPEQKDEEQALADKAWLAIDDAKDLLRENGRVVP